MSGKRDGRSWNESIEESCREGRRIGGRVLEVIECVDGSGQGTDGIIGAWGGAGTYDWNST